VTPPCALNERQTVLSSQTNVAYSSCLGHGFGAVWKRVASFSFQAFLDSTFTNLEVIETRRGLNIYPVPQSFSRPSTWLKQSRR
jgi:hypothetical protein